MAVSTIVPSDYQEHESTVILQTAMDIVSNKFHEPAKSTPLVNTVEILEDDSTMVDTPEVVTTPEITILPEIVTAPEVTLLPEVVDIPEVVAIPEVTTIPAAIATPEVIAIPEAIAVPEATKFLEVTAPLEVAPIVPPSEDNTLEETDRSLRLSDVVSSVLEPTSGAKKLRKMLLETNELIVCPGVYDGLSARTAIELGFNAMYMTGAGTTASRIGQPDLAIAQLHEMRENAEMIANLDPFGPPLIADMDTGYGGPIMVARTVEQYIRAGVAGAHLEDQVLTKRCGHLSGKKVVPQEEYISRIKAAHAARVRLQSDFVLIARTDALQTLGYDACISRLRAARDEGADVGLLEGFTSKAQAAQAVQDLAPWPLLLNSVENGKSPVITVDEASKMGFRIMIFSFATLAPAYVAIRETLARLKYQGIVGTPKHITPVKLFEVCGLEHSMAVDKNAGGLSFMGGV